MRIWASVACGVALMLASALPVHAFSNVSEFTTNWDNYRYCAADADNPLETCGEADVRSPSWYHMSDGSQATLQITSSGVTKFRIDNVSLDNNVTSCTSAYKVQFGSCTTTDPLGVDCLANPSRPGTCSTGESCCTTAHCELQACKGGPHADERCTNVSTCTNIVGEEFKIVFRGVANAMTPSGIFPWQYYKMNGDTIASDADGPGCTRTCTFQLTGSNPQINSNDMSSSCTTAGDCGGGGPINFYSVDFYDPNGEIFAIPTRGTAKLQTNNYVVYGDPAKEGDYCRTQTPPPANCP